MTPKIPFHTLWPSAFARWACLNIPKRFGGWGADIDTTARCVQILAEGDPAITLGFNMHFGVIGFFRGMWREADQARFFPGVARDGHLFDASTVKPARA